MSSCKIIFILLGIINLTNGFGQIVEDISIVNFSKIGSYFIVYESKNDTTYNLIDTTFILDDSERIMILSEFKSGKKIRVLGIYDNGNKYRETLFNEKGRNGFDIKWYKNGEKEFAVYSVDGHITMPILSWYSNGNLKKYVDFDKNIIKEWFITGKLKSESMPNDSNEYGTIMNEYYEDGHLKSVNYYNIGKGLHIELYQNENVARRGYIYNVDIFQVGHWQEWYNNGNIKRDYYFSENKPNIKTGTWKWWDEMGNIQRIEVYNDGELINIEENQKIPNIKLND